MHRPSPPSYAWIAAGTAAGVLSCSLLVDTGQLSGADRREDASAMDVGDSSLDAAMVVDGAPGDVATGTDGAALRPDASLADDFGDARLDPKLWTVGGIDEPGDPLVQVSETLGQLQVRPRSNFAGVAYNGYTSTQTYDLTNRAVAVRVVQRTSAGTSANTSFTVAADKTRTVSFTVEYSSLFFQWFDGQYRTLAMIPFSAMLHVWWRFRASTTTIYWETSPDGSAWTTQATLPPPFALDAVHVAISAGTYESVAQPGTAIFDDVRMYPAP